MPFGTLLCLHSNFYNISQVLSWPVINSWLNSLNFLCAHFAKQLSQSFSFSIWIPTSGTIKYIPQTPSLIKLLHPRARNSPRTTRNSPHVLGSMNLFKLAIPQGAQQNLVNPILNAKLKLLSAAPLYCYSVPGYNLLCGTEW